MGTVYHTLEAYLYLNKLTDDEKSYYARIVANRSLSFDEICQSAVTRGGCTMSVDQIKNCVTAFLNETSFLLCDGYGINTDWFNASLKVTGKFDNAYDEFDEDVHRKKFVLLPGTVFRNELEATSIEIKGLAEGQAYINKVVDTYTGDENSTLTVNCVLQICGDKIKVAGEDESVGVYFVSATDGTTTRVETAKIVRNYPSEVEVMIPELDAGDYTVRVITQYNKSHLLNSPRTIDYDGTLTVP